MMTGNLKKNLGLQTIYQVLNTCLPLITAPYLARTLGAKQLGIFSYTLYYLQCWEQSIMEQEVLL